MSSLLLLPADEMSRISREAIEKKNINDFLQQSLILAKYAAEQGKFSVFIKNTLTESELLKFGEEIDHLGFRYSFGFKSNENLKTKEYIELIWNKENA